MLELFFAFFLVTCTVAENYRLDRHDKHMGKFLALPLVVGFAVGLGILVCGFGLWVRAEGFRVCSQTRAEQEKEYAKPKRAYNPPEADVKVDNAEETGI